MVELPHRPRSVGIAALLTASVLAPAPARAGDPFAWITSDCAVASGDTVTLTLCGDCGALQSSAAVVAPVQGTYTMLVDFTLEAGATEFNWLEVDAGNLVVAYQSWQLPWCAPSPCSGSFPPIQAHVQAGDVLWLRAIDVFGDCAFIGGAETSVTFHDITFVPDVGFVPGVGSLDGSVLMSAHGEAAQQKLGLSVAPLADIDGDGVRDVAAGGVSAGKGLVRFLSGATGAKLRDVPSPTGSATFGLCMAALGDVDGDGRSDLAVGSQSGSDAVHVLSGDDGAVLLSIPAPAVGQNFGWAVGAAGDLDGDGVPDVLVGAGNATVGGVNGGAARAYSGATGALLLQVGGLAAGDSAGSSVAGAGDVNGDGVPDLIVGAPGAGPNHVGAVRLHSGTNGALLHVLPGPASGLDFGQRVASAGDLDGDGVGDVLASDPSAQPVVEFQLDGHVRAFSGATGALLFAMDGGAYDQLGWGLAAAGDFDGDGRDDAAIAAGQGYALIVSGATHGVLAKVPLGFYADSPGPYDIAATSCASGVDHDGDGHGDLVLGFPIFTPGPPLTAAGLVELVSGHGADHQPPTLTGAGALLPVTPLALTIAKGDSLATAFLVAGASQVNLAFKGGVLVPDADLVLPCLLGGNGALTLNVQWPAGIPPGTNVWLQAWVLDGDGPYGFVASAALQIIAP